MKLWEKVIAVIGVGLLLFCFWGLVNTLIYRSGIDFEQDTFRVINETRRDCGLPCLTWNEELATEAREHSRYMADTRNLEHSNLPYAETVLRGVSLCNDGECIYKIWASSREHFLILMSRNCEYGAVGISGDYATFLTW